MMSFFQRGVLDEIWNLTESVSEEFSYLFLRPSSLSTYDLSALYTTLSHNFIRD